MPNVGFVIVYVKNVAASQAFYSTLLGQKAVDASETFAMLPAGPGLMLGLWRRDGVAPAANEAGGSEIAFPVGQDAEVDRLFGEWRAHGVVIALAPTRMDFGYTFVGLDPDGQRLRVFAPPAR
jgi:catechol 2,3-dioxygenase-like lactoylglutathione lyase family enzyme